MRYFLRGSFLVLFLIYLGFAVNIPLGTAGQNEIRLLSQNSDELILEVNIAQLEAETVTTPWGDFTRLTLPEFEGKQLEVGKAVLPAVHQLFDQPYGAETEVQVLESEFSRVDLKSWGIDRPVLPYQGPIEKTEEALRNHQFVMDQSYYSSANFERSTLASVRTVGNLRGHLLGQLRLNAVQYAPKTNELRIYHHLRVAIRFRNADRSMTQTIHEKYASPYFQPLLKDFLINLQSPESEDLTVYPVHYHIIYADAFANEIQPLIRWNRQKGFIVTATPISQIGNTVSNIKAHLQNLYNSNLPPTFVILAGDKEQIATDNGTTGSHVTDLYYTTMTSGDFVPDFYIGRLSAQAPAQLTAMIDKIMVHEKYQFPQTAFLNHGSFVATDDMGNYTTAEGTHNYVIDTHFIPNNLQYDKLYAITYGATGQDVMNALNDGRFIINYSGHGSTTSWAGPNVSQSMVNSSTNVNMYPFVISNACLTGSFELPECFGETWSRKANGGALAFTGASNSTYWDEDDDWERRAYDGVFWEDYWTLGAFIFRGNLAVLNAGYSRAQYYFEVYHLFGDPSNMLYWGEPSAMTVTYPGALFIGSPSFEVTVSGEDSAFVALTMGDSLYGAGFTDNTGLAQITLDPVPTQPGYMTITVTKFNRQPFVDSVQVIPASGPYLYCVAKQFDDSNGNNNGIPEAGETLAMQLQITNVGVAQASNIISTITTADTMLEIISGQVSQSAINAGDTSLVGTFQIKLNENIPHQGSCSFNLHMEADGGHSWDQTLSFRVRKGAKIELVNAPLTFPATFLNFTSEQTLKIKNSGPDTLYISEMVSDLPEYTVNPASGFIAPGATQNFTVQFTPTAVGNYAGTITVRNSDPQLFETHFSAVGEGIYAPDITALPDSIERTLGINDSTVIPVVIKNEGLGELTYSAQIAGQANQLENLRGSGGADNYGHIWIDSDEADGPDFQWVEINQTGTPINITGNNAISDKINIGFSFPFYGQSYDKFRVCTNGWLSFLTYSVSYNNTQLPSLLAPRAMVAPLWDDLLFQSDSKAWFQNFGNKTVVEFENVYRVTGEGPYTFQVLLYDNGNIILQYLHLNGLLDDYTVGIQNAGADDGLTVAFNQPYLKDSLAVLISKHSWATVSPMSGSIAAQSQDTLFLKLKTAGLPMGEFWASIQIESNDPDENLYYVPIHLVVDSTVLNLDDWAANAPRKFALEQNWPNPFNPETMIQYALPRSSRVSLVVYNTLGQKVKTLVNQTQAADTYRIKWDGTNDLGRQVASGIYIYRLEADGFVSTKKMILMR